MRRAGSHPAELEGCPWTTGVTVRQYAQSEVRRMRRPMMQKADKFSDRLSLRKSFGGVSSEIKLVRFHTFADKLKQPVYSLPPTLQTHMGIDLGRAD